jgi:Lon protease-like protein
MAVAQRYKHMEDLPRILPVFPLPQAILLPRAHLPLNIFEPRYLAMVDAAMSGDRMIGMIQPATLEHDNAPPALSRVGGAGRITSYQETDDGRYLIVLSGVCRFAIRNETTNGSPYRTVDADWSSYACDLWAPQGEPRLDRAPLLDALKAYLLRNGFSVDWTSVADAPIETLINALCEDCPFTNAEKQALVEAQTLEDRCDVLTTLLTMERSGQNGGYVQ